MKKIVIRSFIILGVLVALFLSILFYTINLMSKAEILTKNIDYSGAFTYSSSGHILIDVSIGGIMNHFLLDNGVPSTIIFKEMQDKFHFRKVSYLPSRDAFKNISLNPIFRIDTIKLKNGIIAVDVSAAMVSSEVFACNENVYGIIGRDLMKNFIWQFDFKNKKYSVTTRIENLKIRENSISIPILEKSMKDYISLEINSHENIFMVDIGSTVVINHKLPLDSIGKYYNNNLEIIGNNSYGLNGSNKTSNKMYRVLIDSISIGEKSFFNLEGDVSKNTFNLLGLGFFKNFVTTINYPKRELILTPYYDVKFIHKKLGIGFEFVDSTLTVSAIIKESIPFNEGISVRDTVVSYNNIVINSEFNLCTNRNKRDTLKLVIKRNDNLFYYNIPQHFYFTQLNIKRK